MLGVVADLPFDLDPALAERLGRALDAEDKIPRAFEALGPVGDRDVVLVDTPSGIRTAQLESLGARVRLVGPLTEQGFDASDASADAVIGCWSAFRGAPAAELAEARRLLRPDGRLLALHDYGRDDVTRLRGDQPEFEAWSRRDGPFLSIGFKLHVVHCWWTFDSLEEARGFLDEAFGQGGLDVAATLRRPRLSYNVAIYHRGTEALPS